jgi:hypothetical protein
MIIGSGEEARLELPLKQRDIVCFSNTFFPEAD